MKINRALEVHNGCPNVIVSGANGIDYITNEGLKYIIKKHGRNNQN
jgi:hypothetical protein